LAVLKFAARGIPRKRRTPRDNPNRIRGSGKTNQVKSCPDKKGGKAERKALIECLAPNRRVVVEMKGMPK
jgi:hypothetical protein